jgi:uncharacterized membrane protein YfcA
VSRDARFFELCVPPSCGSFQSGDNRNAGHLKNIGVPPMTSETEATIAASKQTLRTMSNSSPAPQSWRASARFCALAVTVAVFAAAGPGLGSPNAVVMAAILLASFVSSIGGFAFPAICGAMLFRLVADPVQVVQMMMACGIANQAAMIWSLRRKIVWRELSVFLVGGAMGLPLGIWALLHADRGNYTEGLGLFLLLYGLCMLFRRPYRLAVQHRLLDVLAGFLGGITGGAAGFPSSAVTIWCAFKGWDKARQRALFQPFILLMQATALLAISLTRRQIGHGAGFDPGVLLCIPAGLLGTALGMALFRRFSTQQFATSMNLLLVASGLSYLL